MFPCQASSHSGLNAFMYTSSISLSRSIVCPCFTENSISSMYSLYVMPTIFKSSSILSDLLFSYSSLDSSALLYFFMIISIVSLSSSNSLTFLSTSGFLFPSLSLNSVSTGFTSFPNTVVFFIGNVGLWKRQVASYL